MGAILIAIFIVSPALLILLTRYQRWANRIGVILLCYLSGLALGGSGLLPQELATVQQGLMSAAIALAIPLLLFGMDLKQWRSKAGSAALSMLFAVAAAVCTATALYYVFRGEDPARAADMAALVTGVYTGGTPNLAAVKEALDISHSLFIVVHSIDTLATGIYLLFLLSTLPLIRRYLGNREQLVVESPIGGDQGAMGAESEDYIRLLNPSSIPQLACSILLSLLVVLVSYGLAYTFSSFLGIGDSSAIFIVLLTSISILLSLNRRVRALRFSYLAGMYSIYVFCLTVAAMVSFSDFIGIDIDTVIFVFAAVFGTMLLHMLFCKLAGVDADTFMVTSVAAICSPPFVPMIARALNNSQAILSGMAAGILGYVLGSYLGIALGLALRSVL